MRLKRSALLIAAAVTLSAATFPDPRSDLDKQSGRQTAVLAGGCFWCTEVVFEHLAGVEKVVSGYAGGKASDANYKLVSAGRTDHAEVIEVTYDPSRVTYGQLLKVFFSVAHDPTQLNRQGPDYGKQYRSAVFYKTEAEKKVVEAYIAQLNAAKLFMDPIVTTLEPLTKFHPAEDYHQDFVKNNPRHGYVVVNAWPKVEKLKKLYPEWVKK
ncbi:MAG: peptide-methionine (S)-S-oxide reductase MsrA [Bryobacterales bacterium]|nr:peptide-methionine (S)-S-oxide reductase MsrA [Bryobacterales bacterium]